MEFSEINYLAVLVSGLIAFGLGALWYTKILFGNTWMRETGVTQEQAQQAGVSGMITTMGGSFVLMLVMILGLAMIMSAQVGTMDLKRGLLTGVMTGAMFSATSIGINYLYQRKTLTLYIIDAVYQVTYMGIAGMILAIWK